MVKQCWSLFLSFFVLGLVYVPMAIGDEPRLVFNTVTSVHERASGSIDSGIFITGAGNFQTISGQSGSAPLMDLRITTVTAAAQRCLLMALQKQSSDILTIVSTGSGRYYPRDGIFEATVDSTIICALDRNIATP